MKIFLATSKLCIFVCYIIQIQTYKQIFTINVFFSQDKLNSRQYNSQ